MRLGKGVQDGSGASDRGWKRRMVRREGGAWDSVGAREMREV